MYTGYESCLWFGYASIFSEWHLLETNADLERDDEAMVFFCVVDWDLTANVSTKVLRLHHSSNCASSTNPLPAEFHHQASLIPQTGTAFTPLLNVLPTSVSHPGP